MDRIKEILMTFKKEDAKDFKETVDELCSKGIGNGCYQNYPMLFQILSILSEAENIIAKGLLSDE